MDMDTEAQEACDEGLTMAVTATESMNGNLNPDDDEEDIGEFR